MPFYHKLGDVPHKRHTQFRKPNGSLYREEVMGLEGFSSIQSILYHHFLPPRAMSIEDLGPVGPDYLEFGPLCHRAFSMRNVPPGGDPISAKRVLLGNDDVMLSISRPAHSLTSYYRNAQAYEAWFVHEGRGLLRTQFGQFEFFPSDYIVIPFGTTWKTELYDIVESPPQIEPPRRYRNEYGQLLEHSPYCKRDLRLPANLECHTERGEFEVLVKARNHITRHVLDHHSFDVIGWDGNLYAWILNIQDFEPITGRIHQPPPVHQTFQGRNFVVFSFVPRLFDYHPEAVPIPYNHSNVNSDEVIYYCEGNFMSRKGIEKYDVTLHPFGLPHGPQPGATEAALGKVQTEELAVMVNAFYHLQVTEFAIELQKKDYMASWLEGSAE